jgi:GDP-4-dehydro-6-deoxy-D-mannose reductase
VATWLITGATGFLGRHVLDAVEAETGRDPAHRVVVLGRKCPWAWPEDQFVRADLTDPARLAAAVREIAPDYVLHTAGKTPPATDEELYQGNFWPTIHLLNALENLGREVRVTLAGSAAELGLVPEDRLPVDESYPCNPVTAYGRGKWMATVAGLSKRKPLDVRVARIFNPIGPGMPVSQAFGDFAQQLAGPGDDPLAMTVGNLNARRDFIDVRDVARAMLAITLRGKPATVYHVGMGQSRSVREGLEFLIHLSERNVKVSVSAAKRTRKEPADSRAEIRRIVDDTGWTPGISMEESLADLWTQVRKPHQIAADSGRARLPLTA